MFDAEIETDHSEYLEMAAECERGGFLIYLEETSFGNSSKPKAVSATEESFP